MPIDTNTMLGRGILAPLRRKGNDFVSGEGIIAVQSSVAQILKTQKGELRWRPDFGIDAERYRHKNVTDTVRDELSADVLNALLKFESRIDVRSIDINQDGSNRNRIYVKVRWVARARNSPRNVVVTNEQTTEVEI